MLTFAHGIWDTMGSPIFQPEDNNGRFGLSIAINMDASIMIIASPHPSRSSQVLVYEYITNEWKKSRIGQDTNKHCAVVKEININDSGDLISIVYHGISKIVLWEREDSVWRSIQELVSGDKVSYTGPVTMDGSGNSLCIGGYRLDDGKKMIFIYKRNIKNPAPYKEVIQQQASNLFLENSVYEEDKVISDKLLFDQGGSRLLILPATEREYSKIEFFDFHYLIHENLQLVQRKMQSNNDDVVFALMSLYDATNGDESWKPSNNWGNTNLNVCKKWLDNESDRLQCRANEFLVKLDLYDWGLDGTLPTDIGLLKDLHTLVLKANPDLRGKIPSEIGMLSNLKTLRLGDTNLSGTIPTEIGLLRSLELLNLSRCKLTGPIPSEIGRLANIDDLKLASNYLTETIPVELESLGDRIRLEQNMLHGTMPAGLCLL